VPTRHGHGHSKEHGKSPTYHSWENMLKRVRDPNNHNYPDYGGRGITVCERWQGQLRGKRRFGGFENFLADMGERPEGKTLDRIDVNEDYEPGNCRWATVQEQRANRRDVLARAA
jgi:hypothetical protein